LNPELKEEYEFRMKYLCAKIKFISRDTEVLSCTPAAVEHLKIVKRAIEEEGDFVKIYKTETSYDQFIADKTDFIISYGYKYLIKGELLERYQGRIINLHPSLLPWGRGYFPNFWSHVFGFRKGVSIHLIDAGIDTGAVLAQREHFFDDSDTLRTSYYELQMSMLCLFTKVWGPIRNEKVIPLPQNLSDGNTFYKKQFDLAFPFLPKGFDTRLVEVQSLREKIIGSLRDGGYDY
jgi:methionyl-tRNA formyltransferase